MTARHTTRTQDHQSGEAAKAITALLAQGSAAGDREAVEALKGAQRVDAVLEAIDVGALAGLLDRAVERATEADRGAVWDVLDLVRRPSVLTRVQDDRAAWSERLLRAVEASHFTVGPLFRHRARTYESKVLFELPQGARGRSMTWQEVAGRVDAMARGLLALGEPDEVQPVAILSENRLESALVDLACLTSGLVDVLIPANATVADVGFILRQAKVRTVVVSDADQWAKVRDNGDSLPGLRRVIALSPIEHPGPQVVPLEEVLAGADRVEASVPEERGRAVRIGDLATVMYTSGTTGVPKGVRFSHRNVVFKRFARALALPEIGERDVFLCYLPLFHTFGRYLELLGAVFWGATYCFHLNPSLEALIGGMRRYRPTVFISVPRKWIQLYEAVAQHADPLHGTDEELLAVTRDLTGGRLRWGLSAAGHLDADVFRFFHRQGIELLSGFGMSEATGGITMTPPGRYKDNSLGVPLPGVEIKLDTDGELMLRGPYVMMGYMETPEEGPEFDEEGWLRSGDLMEMDQDGYIRLVDRKKEIYKNVKGQTIAPQRIENLFREFESVGRAFLVGDHREYNTLLIYPNPAYTELDFATLPPEEIRDHFRSLVVSVNKFVAPFERVVDFAIVDRDLDEARGELTPKGTPRRKVVEEHFADRIADLYQRTTLSVGGVELTIPNWVLQQVGLTAQDVRAGREALSLPTLGTSLRIAAAGETEVAVGPVVYRRPRGPLNLGALLATPRLWLGNEALVAFAPLHQSARHRPGRAQEGLEWVRRALPYVAAPDDPAAVEDSARRTEWDLTDVDRAARLLAGEDEGHALAGVRLLERVVTSDDEGLAEPARQVLWRAADARWAEVRRRAFQALVPSERVPLFRGLLERFFTRDPGVLDAETSAFLCERALPEAKLDALAEYAQGMCLADAGATSEDELTPGLLRFLAEYGAAHPTGFRRIRAFLVRMSLFCRSAAVRERAGAARLTLEEGFRQFLGPTSRIAVDTETAQEYRWDDVIVFDDATAETHRKRLLAAIKTTAFLREAIFLFFRGTMIRLHDIPPGGVWIRQLGVRHGKSVYRITVQTRSQDTFDLAANVVDDLTPERVREEIDYLVLCGESGGRAPVVEDFGGYYDEHHVWTEEYVPGDTLDRELRRLARRGGEEGLKQLWPFLAWSALSAYVDFWDRTGRTCEMAELSPTDIVLPTHDYHHGSRIVSLSARRPHQGLFRMLQAFSDEFVEPVQREYAVLEGMVGWDQVLSSLLEVLGERAGLAALERALEAEPDGSAESRDAVRHFVETVRVRGFLPMRLYFAVKRFRRWDTLNVGATAAARARMLKELSDTYGLDRLARAYPETRLRFFRETVFRDAAPELTRGLDEIIDNVRTGAFRNGELAGAVADLRHRLTTDPDADYFLARIPFTHLRPEDEVDFVSTESGGGYQSEIVVTLEDADGNPFRVRHAMSPKEVERLHRIYVAAKLDVRFRPEHRYLVAVNDRQQIIGGIFYDVEEGGARAHLEKIVVSERYRRKGVADGLMHEFFNRLRATGVKRVTTGFFRPEYFYAYGFRIERRYAGLMKTLVEEPEGEVVQ